MVGVSNMGYIIWEVTCTVYCYCTYYLLFGICVAWRGVAWRRLARITRPPSRDPFVTVGLP